MMGLYRVIYNSLPSFYKNWVKRYLVYSNFTIPPEKYAGFSILYGLILFVSVTIFLFFIGLATKTASLVTGFLLFFTFEAFMHGILIYISDSRANFADEAIPDVLSLLSSNIRSGLTPDKALMLSAREEFGPLEEEIKRAAKKTLSGESIEEAIKIIPERINSKSLERTVSLLSEGMAKGGSLQDLLDGLANDIRETRLMKREISAQVMVYAIFIFFAVAIGAPVLLAVSSHLIETMGTISKGINTEYMSLTTNTLSFKFQKIQIDPAFLLRYSISSLIVTSIFGGILIGLIREGSERGGIKYIPILLAISITIFFLARIIIFKFFSIPLI